MGKIDRHMGHDGSTRPVILLVLIALAAILTWLLWPVRITLEGRGTVQPRFENLVRVSPEESGMVCRVMAEPLQEVRAGESLLEYVPAGKFSVLAYARMTPPGGAAPEPEPLPVWYEKVKSERIARTEAANRWSSQVRSQGNKALRWEHDLAQRLSMLVSREGDLTEAQAQQRENIRLGRENANKVYVFDEVRGEMVATERGIPLLSPATGILYSLWVQPKMQTFASLHDPLPVPVPGGPVMTALSVGTSPPVAEIIPPGTPLEVLALLSVPPRSLQKHEGWQVRLTGGGQGIAAPAPVTRVEIGRVPLNPADAGLLVPELSSGQAGVFSRISLPENNLQKIGTAVQVRLVSPLRPRAWFWLAEKWDNP
jgi:hypothetical protein